MRWINVCKCVCLFQSHWRWKCYHHTHPPPPSGVFQRDDASFSSLSFPFSSSSSISSYFCLHWFLFFISLHLHFILSIHPIRSSSLPLSAPQNSNLNKKAKGNPLVTESLEERERKGQRSFARTCVCVCKRKGWREGERENTKAV